MLSDDDESDPRERVEAEILYKQAVGTEDVYFGMDPMKDPSSTSCELMVVKAAFPGNRFKDLDLDVKKQKLVAQSPTHKLAIYLPHPVDPEEGSAKFDSDKCLLTVTLPILRDEF